MFRRPLTVITYWPPLSRPFVELCPEFERGVWLFELKIFHWAQNNDHLRPPHMIYSIVHHGYWWLNPKVAAAAIFLAIDPTKAQPHTHGAQSGWFGFAKRAAFHLAASNDHLTKKWWLVSFVLRISPESVRSLRSAPLIHAFICLRSICNSESCCF